MSGVAAHLNRFPPKLCRLVARKNGGHYPMTFTDIAQAAGMSRSLAIKISRMNGWGKVQVDKADAFASACGVNLMDTSDQIEFLRTRKKAYMARANAEQRRMFDRIMRELSGNLNREPGTISH